MLHLCPTNMCVYHAKFDLVFIYNTLIDLKNCDTRLMDNYITVALHGNSVIWYRNRKILTQSNCGGKITSFLKVNKHTF